MRQKSAQLHRVCTLDWRQAIKTQQRLGIWVRVYGPIRWSQSQEQKLRQCLTWRCRKIVELMPGTNTTMTCLISGKFCSPRQSKFSEGEVNFFGAGGRKSWTSSIP